VISKIDLVYFKVDAYYFCEGSPMVKNENTREGNLEVNMK
jgi:hypothetical protein